MDIAYIGSALLIFGLIAGWSWRVARWLIDIKDGIQDIRAELVKVNTRQDKFEADLNKVWEFAGWVRAKMGEPAPERRE